jgi:hypothetical protein
MLIVLALAAVSGCQFWTQFVSKDPFDSKAPCALGKDAGKDEIIAFLNKNIEGGGEKPALTGWRSDTVRVHATGLPVGVPATVAIAAPHNLRLRISNPVSHATEMDLGSNDRQFWVWAKQAPQQAIMTCAHEDVPAALAEIQMPIPFDPAWVMEVFGVVPFDASQYRMEKAGGPLVDLVSERHGADGQPVLHVVRVNACHGIIVEHQLRRSDGELIARAILHGHYHHPETKIVLVKQIRLEWPATESFISFDFNGISVNPDLQTDSPVWQVPEMPGTRRVDLGELVRARARLRQGQNDGGRTPLIPDEQDGVATVSAEEADDAPAWPGAAADAAAPNVELSLDEEDWKQPTEEPGKVGLDELEFETPQQAEESTVSPRPMPGESIRMQSPGTTPFTPAPQPRQGFFSWLFGRSKPTATAPPAAYSPAASRSSSGRLPWGLE